MPQIKYKEDQFVVLLPLNKKTYGVDVPAQLTRLEGYDKPSGTWIVRVHPLFRPPGDRDGLRECGEDQMQPVDMW